MYLHLQIDGEGEYAKVVMEGLSVTAKPEGFDVVVNSNEAKGLVSFSFDRLDVFSRFGTATLRPIALDREAGTGEAEAVYLLGGYTIKLRRNDVSIHQERAVWLIINNNKGRQVALLSLQSGERRPVEVGIEGKKEMLRFLSRLMTTVKQLYNGKGGAV
jgi:hypothetical protein